jgi:hypothetical protein
VGANAVDDEGLPTPRAEGWEADKRSTRASPPPPHGLYSTHPTQHCACLPGGGGEELRGGGWEAGDVQVFVTGVYFKL